MAARKPKQTRTSSGRKKTGSTKQAARRPQTRLKAARRPQTRPKAARARTQEPASQVLATDPVRAAMARLRQRRLRV